METRALAIAFFYAVGTAIGGIDRPAAVRAAHRHRQADDLVVLGFFIGAGLMALGGVAELLLGVEAEQQSLEDIAEAAHGRGRRGARSGYGSGASGVATAAGLASGATDRARAPRSTPAA